MVSDPLPRLEQETKRKVLHRFSLGSIKIFNAAVKDSCDLRSL